jgi:hypothetical protein
MTTDRNDDQVRKAYLTVGAFPVDEDQTDTNYQNNNAYYAFEYG